MSQDRRIHARVATKLPARLVRGSEGIDGLVENLGQGGVFFATETLEVPLEDGAHVRVEFEVLRGGAPVRFLEDGTVLRADRYFDGQSVVRSFAIRFDREIDLTGLTIG